MKFIIQFGNCYYEVKEQENLDFSEISKNVYLLKVGNRCFLFSFEKSILYDGKNSWFLKITRSFSNNRQSEKSMSKIEIRSPIPGLIVEVLVNEGEDVKKNQNLFIIEAMKMRNQIKSPIDGKVKHISVNKNKTVEANQLLCIIES
jgi:biotin carboxyl carrier protein